MASYPTSVVTFPVWVNGDDIDPPNQNDPNNEITAVENGLLAGFVHNVNAPGFRYDDATSVTITSGAITITTGYLEVDTEGLAATDDLDTITIGVMASGVAIGEGSVIVLQIANASRQVVVKNGTGNISMAGDFVMAALTSRLTLMYSGSAWVELARTPEPWTDYSGTSTIVGWSAFTTKKISYRRVQKLVYVEFQLEGTSNATSATFTLPFTRVTSGSFAFTFPLAGDIQDNSAAVTTNAYGQISSASATVTTAISAAGTGWTNSGTKRIAGTFFYESA